MPCTWLRMQCMYLQRLWRSNLWTLWAKITASICSKYIQSVCLVSHIVLGVWGQDTGSYMDALQQVCSLTQTTIADPIMGD